MSRARRNVLDDRRDQLFAAFTGQVILDCWLEATEAYWERRARQLEAARPRPDDFTGQASPTELIARFDRLTSAAHACRNRGVFHDATRAEFAETLAAAAAGEHDRAGDRAA